MPTHNQRRLTEGWASNEPSATSLFDIPVEEAYEMLKRKEKPPEHMANSLYLEWFSEKNGRVVIESQDYELTISAPEWRMTPEENEQRARDAANGLNDFMRKLTGSDTD